MKISSSILNFTCKRQKLVEGLAIFLLFLSVSFSFGNGNTAWLWEKIPFIAFILVTIGVVLLLIRLNIEKERIKQHIQELKPNDLANRKIILLTPRQKIVFDLIQEGKSNKDISAELFIELSTLKTHINKIYKTLEISSRKEARNFK